MALLLSAVMLSVEAPSLLHSCNNYRGKKVCSEGHQRTKRTERDEIM